MTTTTKLIAYHGDPAIKAKYLARIEPHRGADEVVQGFLAAIKPGADLSQVVDRFCLWLLTSPDMRLAELAEPDGKLAITQVADLYRRRLARDEPTVTEWAAARTARTVAGTAVWDAFRSTASDAARAAARAAANAADAAGAAENATANADAADAARFAAWILMATSLEELLGSVPTATVDLPDETTMKP